MWWCKSKDINCYVPDGFSVGDFIIRIFPLPTLPCNLSVKTRVFKILMTILKPIRLQR